MGRNVRSYRAASSGVNARFSVTAQNDDAQRQQQPQRRQGKSRDDSPPMIMGKKNKGCR